MQTVRLPRFHSEINTVVVHSNNKKNIDFELRYLSCTYFRQIFHMFIKMGRLLVALLQSNQVGSVKVYSLNKLAINLDIGLGLTG